MNTMVSYKLLSFYHEISRHFSECRINLELLLRIYFFTHIFTKEQVEEFNKEARKAKAKATAIQKADQYLKEKNITGISEDLNNKPKQAKVIIEVPEFSHDNYTKFVGISLYHTAFSYFETYLSKIINYVFTIETQYQSWTEWEKDDKIYWIFHGRAEDRMEKIQVIVNLNHQFTDADIKGLDRFLTVRNLFAHNGGVLKPFHIERLGLNEKEYSANMEYGYNNSYMDIQGLIDFLTFFDELVVNQYKSIPRF